MADDELNQNPSDEELEQSEASRVDELEGLVAQKDEELTETNARIVELEQAVADRDSEIATLKQSNAESDEKITTIGNSMTEAVASYRALVVQANPSVPEELVIGDSIEAIDQSLENARSLVFKVRQGLEIEASNIKVPAGAPERISPDLSALSPREKIQYAIGGRR